MSSTFSLEKHGILVRDIIRNGSPPGALRRDQLLAVLAIASVVACKAERSLDVPGAPFVPVHRVPNSPSETADNARNVLSQFPSETSPPRERVPPFAVDSISAPKPHSGGGWKASFAARVRSRSDKRIDHLAVSVRVIDDNGSRIDELEAHKQSEGGESALAARGDNTWQFVLFGLDPDKVPVLDLDQIQVVPRSAAFCDGSTWEAEGASVPPNPMLKGCPSERSLGDLPPLELRDGRVHGPGYSFAVPEEYDVDERWAGRSLRRRGTEEGIGILPGLLGWIDLEPAAFDDAQCRNLLDYNGSARNLRFEVRRVSPDVTTCARYITSQSREIIQEIIVATRKDDVRVMCMYEETLPACLAIAASWRVE